MREGTTPVALTACSPGTTGAQAPPGILLGTTDKVTALYPAGSWDLGSATLQNQVFSWLLTSAPGSTDPVPDLAASAEFTDPTHYRVALREDAAFANGNPLTASDVVFTFERQVAIAAPNGPSSLLSDMVSVEAEDDSTVVFTLATPDNALWPQILTSPAAAIVDEDVLSADSLTTDDDIVAGDAFSGQYSITSYKLNSLVQLTRNDSYDGLLGAAANESVIVRYYADESNLKLDIQRGEIAVAYRTLNATDTEDLRGEEGLTVHSGPGAEMRFLVFNPETMPYGSATSEADADKALAVRTAVADLIDRDELSDQVYKGTYAPVYSIVPSALTGSTPAYEEAFGDGSGGPSADEAAAALQAAGITGPVDLKLQYNTDHYGSSTSDEYALIKNQLERSGLFTVDLQSTEWTQYVKEKSTSYPLYQQGWFADYPDSDNYLNLLYGTDEAPSILGAAVKDDAYNEVVLRERSLAPGDERTAAIEEAQRLAAEKAIIVPLLEGTETVIASSTISGIDDTLDGSGRFRFGLLRSE
ncbi:peptide ABC transporter substrate-binding protein [Rathayibacter sp. AY1F4]|nr:peptide ABC transporter substrate-binding protein [Rathayibacter sp. AY1F4]